MLVTVVGIAIASNGNGRATTRVIADTANNIDRFIFEALEDVSVVHLFGEATKNSRREFRTLRSYVSFA